MEAHRENLMLFLTPTSRNLKIGIGFALRASVLEILSKFKYLHFWSNLIFYQPMVLRSWGVGLLKGGQKCHRICSTSLRFGDIVKILMFLFFVKLLL